MIKIELKHLEEPNKRSYITRERRYRINLGNGNTCYFTNKKVALAYIDSLNNKLNAVVLELNSIYANIFVEYRKNALIYNNYFISVDWKFKNLLNVLESIFYQIYRTTSMANANYNYFGRIETLADHLISFANMILTPLHTLQKEYLFSIINRLNEIINDLKKLGEDVQNNTPPVYYDFKKTNDQIKNDLD